MSSAHEHPRQKPGDGVQNPLLENFVFFLAVVSSGQNQMKLRFWSKRNSGCKHG